MSKVSAKHPQNSPAAFALNRVSRPGWLEIIVGLVVFAIVGFGVGSQLRRLGLDCCHRSRRFQLAHNSGDGSCWNEVIEGIGV
jgi:hypothetical protein